MATVREEAARLNWLISKGRGEERCHVALVEEEARERIANKKEKTRFVMETDSAEMYSRFNELKDLWFRTGNKSVCLTLMADRWDLTEDEIRNLCEGLEEK
jgi:hypothetical protein